MRRPTTLADSVSIGGGTYDYTMAGNLFGTNYGFYAASQSAFNLGESDIEIQRMDVYVAHPDNQARASRGGSTIGAPIGPYSICTADLSDGTCQGTRTIGTNEYKFSIFGYTFEKSAGLYAAGLAAAVASGRMPNPLTHLAVRTKIETVGFEANLTINGVYTLDTIGNRDVTSITMVSPGGVTNIAFPTSFNYGKLGDSSSDGSGTILIRASRASQSGAFLDYLIPISAVNQADQWFVYDPDVTTTMASPPPPSAPPGPPPDPSTPPPPPPPGGATVFQVRFEVSVDLSEFTQTDRDALESTLRTVLVCAPPACTLTLYFTSGSMVVTAVLSFPTLAPGSANAYAASTEAANSLANSTDISQTLNVPVLSVLVIPVAAVDPAPTGDPPTGDPPPPSGGSSTVAIAAGAAGGGLAVILAAAYCYCRTKKKRARSTPAAGVKNGNGQVCTSL